MNNADILPSEAVWPQFSPAAPGAALLRLWRAWRRRRAERLAARQGPRSLRAMPDSDLRDIGLVSRVHVSPAAWGRFTLPGE